MNIYEYDDGRGWRELPSHHVKDELRQFLDAIADGSIGMTRKEDYEVRLGTTNWRVRKNTVELRDVFLVNIENNQPLVSEFLRWMIDNKIVDLGLGHSGRESLVKVLPAMYKAEVDAFFRSRNAK